MLKIMLYNLSLLPLYIVYFLKTFDLLPVCDIDTSLKWYEIVLNFIFILYKPLIFIVLGMVGFVTFLYLQKQTRLKNKLPDKIESFKRVDYEHLTFLATFILPVFALDLKTIKDLMILFFILLFMGVVYIKSEMYYLNPVFLIFGWYLYKIKRSNSEVMALSTFKLDKNCNFIEKKIDKNLIFIQKA